jgi:hypothetical protein
MFVQVKCAASGGLWMKVYNSSPSYDLALDGEFSVAPAGGGAAESHTLFGKGVRIYVFGDSAEIISLPSADKRAVASAEVTTEFGVLLLHATAVQYGTGDCFVRGTVVPTTPY